MYLLLFLFLYNSKIILIQRHEHRYPNSNKAVFIDIFFTKEQLKNLNEDGINNLTKTNTIFYKKYLNNKIKINLVQSTHERNINTSNRTIFNNRSILINNLGYVKIYKDYYLDINLNELFNAKIVKKYLKSIKKKYNK